MNTLFNLSKLKIPAVFSVLFLMFIFTHSMKAQTLHFGVIADTQYCNCENAPQYNRYFAETKARLEIAIDTFNAHDLSFVINLGDIIDKDWESFDDILPVFESATAEKYHVLGNHEFYLEDSLKEKVTARLGMQQRYYSFDKENWRFIVLNAMDLSLQAHPKDSQKYERSDSLFQKTLSMSLPQAKVWNGGIGNGQQRWLENQLKEATSNNQQVIIFSHIPLWPVNMNTLWNNEEILSILESYNCVKAHLAGHYHEGNYEFKAGIHHLTLKGMLDTPDQNAFSIIEITGNQIIIHGYGREQSLELNF